MLTLLANCRGFLSSCALFQFFVAEDVLEMEALGTGVVAAVVLGTHAASESVTGVSRDRYRIEPYWLPRVGMHDYPLRPTRPSGERHRPGNGACRKDQEPATETTPFHRHTFGKMLGIDFQIQD